MPCFPYFTENSTKHPENWCPYVLIPSKVIKKNQLLPFEVLKKLILTWERTSRQVLKKVISLCENFKGSH
jgi:hypothetical protein